MGYSNHVPQGRVRRSCAASFVRRTSSCLAVFFSALSNFGIINKVFLCVAVMSDILDEIVMGRSPDRRYRVIFIRG